MSSVQERAKSVWILNHYASEPESAGGTRHFDLAKASLDPGWRAVIIAASVDHGSGRQRLRRGEKRRSEEHGGVPFLWVRVPDGRGAGIARMASMLAFSARVLVPAVSRQLPSPDVVVGSSVHPFAAYSGAVLARRFRVPFVFEARDLWPQTLFGVGRIQQVVSVPRSCAGSTRSAVSRCRPAIPKRWRTRYERWLEFRRRTTGHGRPKPCARRGAVGVADLAQRFVAVLDGCLS